MKWYDGKMVTKSISQRTSMRQRLIHAGSFLLDILFPPVCLLCRKTLVSGAEARGLCEACRGRIPLHTSLFCGTCGARLPDQKKICHKETPYLLGAASDYRNEAARALIYELKFSRHPAAAVPLADLIADYTRALPLPLIGALLVPIPLHPRRERERGFNQAELIAKRLTETASAELAPVLERVKDTPPQTTLKDYEARKKNMERCFRVAHPERVAGRTVIVLDDVSTSGATLREAARALREAGAKKIVGLVFAKAGS